MDHRRYILSKIYSTRVFLNTNELNLIITDIGKRLRLLFESFANKIETQLIKIPQNYLKEINSILSICDIYYRFPLEFEEMDDSSLIKGCQEISGELRGLYGMTPVYLWDYIFLLNSNIRNPEHLTKNKELHDILLNIAFALGLSDDIYKTSMENPAKAIDMICERSAKYISKKSYIDEYCDKRERESLKQRADNKGVSSERFIKELTRDMNNLTMDGYYLRFKEGIKENRTKEQQDFLNKYFIPNCIEFWKQIIQNRQEFKNELANCIVNVIDNLPENLKILPETINNIKKKLILQYQERSAKSELYKLVNSLPIISSWERKFEAEVIVENNTQIPIILKYIAFEDTTYTLMDFLFSKIQSNQRFDIATSSYFKDRQITSFVPGEEKYNILSNNNAYFRSILDHIVYDKELIIDQGSKAHWNGVKTTKYGVKAIYFHELGHIFLGHLDFVENESKEYEADEFSFYCIMSNFNKEERVYAFAGYIILIYVIDCIDSIYNLNLKNKHSSPQQRYKKLKKLTESNFEKKEYSQLLQIEPILKFINDYKKN